MKILFAAPEKAWGGFLGLIQAEMPEHHFEATGRFAVDTLKGFDVLIPTMCSVSQELLETGDQLRLVQQCGSGLEMVDLDAAKRCNIHVANVPTDISGNADSVAELGIYMIIGLSRDVRGMSKSLAEQSMGQPQGRALNGRTIGLIGLGGIGRALVRKLKVFGVHLIAIKRSNPKNAMEKLGMDWVGGIEDLKKLLSRSDFVILCLPMTSESRNLIDHNAFSFMKNGAFLINLSRGGLVAPSHAYEYDGTNWTEFDWVSSFNQVKSSPEGYLVMATGDGVYHYDGTDHTLFNKDNSKLTANYATCVDVGSDGTEYVGLTAAGLVALLIFWFAASPPN